MEFSVKNFFSKCGQIRSFLGKSKDILKDTLNGKLYFMSSGLIKLAYAKEIQLNYKRSRPKVLLGKVGLKICSKFTEEHPCLSVILLFGMGILL